MTKPVAVCLALFTACMTSLGVRHAHAAESGTTTEQQPEKQPEESKPRTSEPPSKKQSAAEQQKQPPSNAEPAPALPDPQETKSEKVPLEKPPEEASEKPGEKAAPLPAEPNGEKPSGQAKPAGKTGLAAEHRARKIRIDEAKRHFEAALEYYRAGRYRDAIAALERALKADPTGKDLVYNLALVHEKLGELDQAIRYFERYKRMESDEVELARADETLRRLRGARDSLSREKETKPKPSKSRAPRLGRLDGWVWGTAALAVTGLAVGTVLGVQAVVDRPSSEDKTGPETTVAALRRQAEAAHRLAVFADIAWIGGALSGATALTLYFARTTEADGSADRQSAVVGIQGAF